MSRHARAPAFCLTLACLAAATLGWPPSGSASEIEGRVGQPWRFSSVSVDVRALYAQQAGRTADLARDALEAELRRDFADRIGPGPRLVVRLTGVSLNAYAGGEGSRGGLTGNGTNTDYMEGEALVLGRRGEILARYPQLSALNASSGGAWYLPESEANRVVALARHFGGWLRRRIP